jgi:hypothetical protein
MAVGESEWPMTRFVTNSHLVDHLRARLSAISARTAAIVAKMSDEEILERYAAHSEQQRAHAKKPNAVKVVSAHGCIRREKTR